ncbi:hypothetical protein SAMN05518871_101144 [Psychrobacillus sp. OK028]|nr:hypothetical protein [Psychrobacillus sp. OK028]SDM40670.1 hypothetical protein SAMN05518871_101144 [Psychrobacillus sp. OK028]
MKRTLLILAIVTFSIIISVNVEKQTTVTLDIQSDTHSLPIHPPVG